jgi:hypothetical protein
LICAPPAGRENKDPLFSDLPTFPIPCSILCRRAAPLRAVQLAGASMIDVSRPYKSEPTKKSWRAWRLHGALAVS